MASDTNSRARKAPDPVAALIPALASAVERGPVPLLCLRLPEFERLAWRQGKRAARRLERLTIAAFVDSAAGLLRTGDRCAHDGGSDIFTIVMTAPSRDARVPSSIDIRSVLERIAASIVSRCSLRVETGWTMVSRVDPRGTLDDEIAIALERGARERERYEFFSAVGHELRTPLSSIRGYLETLLDDEIDAVTARRFAETARREAIRMGRLLEGMFEFSLLDLSSGSLASQSCDLSRQVAQALDVVHPLARSRGIAVDYATAPALHAAIDSDACLQMLVNLLENAVKYGRGGGHVRVTVREARGEALITVDDDGPGIAAHERECIFGLRARGSNAGSRPGTGIGLAIVKMIAERAGGSVRVMQSPLGGARFEAALPLRHDLRARVS